MKRLNRKQIVNDIMNDVDLKANSTMYSVFTGTKGDMTISYVNETTWWKDMREMFQEVLEDNMYHKSLPKHKKGV